MMKRTHEAFSGVWWLGGCLAVNEAAIQLSYHPPVHPLIAATGLVLCVPFSAGKNSPDIDHMWAPGPPSPNYDWKRHRGITHRFWFGLWVINVFVLYLPLAFAYYINMWVWLVPLIFALPSGWWSHLFGDMIYGKLLILGVRVGLGWTTNGPLEKGGKYFIDPAAKVCGFLTIILMFINILMWIQFTY